MTAEAATAILTSCRHIHAATNATVGSAVSSEPRAPPIADESRSRIRVSTVCAALSPGDLVTMSSLVATGRLDLIGRVEHGGNAVLEGHTPPCGQVRARHYSADPSAPEPDEVEGLAAVIQLHHECRDVDARSQRDASHGATDNGIGAVSQFGDRSGTLAPSVLLQLTGLELQLRAGQPGRDARHQPRLALLGATSLVIRHCCVPPPSGSRGSLGHVRTAADR